MQIQCRHLDASVGLASSVQVGFQCKHLQFMFTFRSTQILPQTDPQHLVLDPKKKKNQGKQPSWGCKWAKLAPDSPMESSNISRLSSSGFWLPVSNSHLVKRLGLGWACQALSIVDWALQAFGIFGLIFIPKSGLTHLLSMSVLLLA